MKIIRQPLGRSRAGFTLIELLVSTSVAMILMFGAIYSSMESFAVVSAGDAQINTQVHTRRIMDRFVRDCRYAKEISVTGDEVTGWTVDLVTGIDSSTAVWTWDAAMESLSLSDGTSTETILTGISAFSLDTQQNDSLEIDRITAIWTVRETAGGTGTSNADRTITVPGSTWIRIHAL